MTEQKEFEVEAIGSIHPLGPDISIQGARKNFFETLEAAKKFLKDSKSSSSCQNFQHLIIQYSRGDNGFFENGKIIYHSTDWLKLVISLREH